MPKVALVMGSKSDLPVLEGFFKVCKEFNVEYEARVLSAHRTPVEAAEFAQGAKSRGVEVICAAAGKAAHLAGAMAANTTLPVIGIPVKSSTLDGLDALLSTVQMPSGMPVATVAINGADNAALLAVQILAIKYPELADKLTAYRRAMTEKVLAADEELNKEIEK
ncbi:MAG: 5-(carboxyamino)imidazole ribonucleotide mutase [Clostridiales bacterium]|nr:5-(carboxyamino)imidazole ribonucleotide mutase [Clostridiales bacterium]MBQ2816476.1 5-(carboxyamino)imidazole ribonucleotide mutase [Clostridia bacterium]